MNCPVCSHTMVEEDFGNAMVDVCKNSCKGIWFDWLELRKLDEKNEGCGKALQEALSYPRTNDEGRGQIQCPKCSVPMFIHKYQKTKGVNVDECYACAGFFLDSGELREIREHSMSDSEEKEYVEQLINNIPEYQKASIDHEKNKLRADALRHFTKFIRASYYVTGK